MMGNRQRCSPAPNGNMTVRVVGGITYTLTYDGENRLTGVAGPITSATFLYDASGNRVLATVNGETTAYIGGVYEHTDTGASTSTYAGSVIRRSGYASGNGVYTMLRDHLGSARVVTPPT